MGTKLSKRAENENEPLSQDTLAELCTDTGFTEEELLKLYENFYKDCPNGKLTLKHFQQEYTKTMGKPSKRTLDYVKHMFNVYDQDKNKFIDFKEFVMALSVSSAVNHVRLVETLFCMYDLDNDGQITKDEIGKMLQTLVDVTNSNRKRHLDNTNESNLNQRTNLQRSIDEAFQELNLNHDDYITKNEFIEWYLNSGFLSDVQSNEINTCQQSHPQEIEIAPSYIEKNQYPRKKNKKDKARASQFIYMTRMIEKKTLPTMDDSDETHLDNSTIHKEVNTDDSNLHSLQENNRWKDLFNSVLERSHENSLEDEQETMAASGQNRINRFNQLKKSYQRQKSGDHSESPDTITVWL